MWLLLRHHVAGNLGSMWVANNLGTMWLTRNNTLHLQYVFTVICYISHTTDNIVCMHIHSIFIHELTTARHYHNIMTQQAIYLPRYVTQQGICHNTIFTL